MQSADFGKATIPSEATWLNCLQDSCVKSTLRHIDPGPRPMNTPLGGGVSHRNVCLAYALSVVSGDLMASMFPACHVVSNDSGVNIVGVIGHV